jgi:succinate dehydrogenase hydrophobic anchor subunit
MAARRAVRRELPAPPATWAPPSPGNRLGEAPPWGATSIWRPSTGPIAHHDAMRSTRQSVQNGHSATMPPRTCWLKGHKGGLWDGPHLHGSRRCSHLCRWLCWPAGPFEDAVATFEKSVAPYDKGDYATALRLVRPLVEQGNQLLTNMTAIVILAIVIGVAALLLIWNGPAARAERIGRRGENFVSRELLELDSEHYKVLGDLMLPSLGNTNTTQIDHVMVSDFGIFCIETKSYSGWIFGNARQQHWTQVLYRYKTKFYNPLWQNYAHIKAVEAIVRPKYPKVPIRGFIAFPCAEKLKITGTDAVGHVEDVLVKITALNAPVLSVADRFAIVGLLSNANIQDKQARKLHNKSVRGLKDSNDNVEPRNRRLSPSSDGEYFDDNPYSIDHREYDVPLRDVTYTDTPLMAETRRITRQRGNRDFWLAGITTFVIVALAAAIVSTALMGDGAAPAKFTLGPGERIEPVPEARFFPVNKHVPLPRPRPMN